MSEEELLKIDSGCTCEKCTKIAKENLASARKEWQSGKREIVIRNWETYEGYEEMIIVNGFTISRNGECSTSVINGLLRFLGIDNVEIEEDDNYKY